MAKNLNIIGICGWAIPEKWFSQIIESTFPNAIVNVHYPKNPNDNEEAKIFLLGKTCDLFIGYSLGSLWLFKNKEYLSSHSKKVFLAPIMDLTSKDHGSKFSIRQLNFLLKQIKNSPDPTFYVQEFFKFCGIDIPENFIKQIPHKDILCQGLEFLLNNSMVNDSLNDFIGVIGSTDELLDSSHIKHFMPHIQIIPDIGHEPQMLLRALSKMKILST